MSLPVELLYLVAELSDIDSRRLLAEAHGWSKNTFIQRVKSTTIDVAARQLRQKWTNLVLPNSYFWYGRVTLNENHVIELFVPMIGEGGTYRIRSGGSVFRAFLEKPETWFEHAGDIITYYRSNVMSTPDR